MKGSKRLGELVQKHMVRSMKWHHRMMDIAMKIETWSKDPSMKVGVVICDDDHRILATGYNGFPRGVEDDEERYADRSLKYPMVVHAEPNAIINSGHDLTGATLYCTAPMVPCPDCMGHIIQAGIKKVVTAAYRKGPDQKKGKGKTDWDRLAGISMTMAEESGVEILLLDAPE